MNNKKILIWGDVSHAVRITLFGLEQEWEALEWMWEAWEIIIDAGLANYSNILELYQVVLRFLTLFSFVCEFFEDWENSYCYKCNLSLVDVIKFINIDNVSYHQILEYCNPYYELFEPILSKTYQRCNEYGVSDLIFSIALKQYRQEIDWLLNEEFSNLLSFFENLSINKNIIKYEDLDVEQELILDTYYFEEEIINFEFTKKLEYLSNRYTEIENDDYYENYKFDSEIIREGILTSTATLEEIELVMDAAEKLAYFFSNSQLNKRYSTAQLIAETGLNETELKSWISAINRKGQIILYGSPGTGKTYIAEKFAKHLIGGGDGFSELVQFHPAYSYEDFIQGIRPQSQDGKLTYPLVPGRFLEFCKKAESRQDTCVLIIDEINRANLAQVFGELMYLLEYRDREIPLAAGNTFRIPDNVRIIGTMNTADRSIAQIDHALRRRFAFIELRPNYDVLRQYHLKTGVAVEDLIKILQELNQAIADKNYEIGISFFLTENLRGDIQDIWQMEIEPYLEEYFFNQLDKVDEFRWDKINKRIHILN